MSKNRKKMLKKSMLKTVFFMGMDDNSAKNAF